MAKVTAPLLSFEAGGQIGKAQVYSKWRGQPYARRYTKPANPNTSAQVQTRSVFRWLAAVWKVMDANGQAPWIGFAKGQRFTGSNAFTSKNLANLRGDTGSPPGNIDDLLASPGNGGGLVAAGLALTDGGTHHAVATLTAPTLPEGWAIIQANAIAIKQQDATSGVAYNSYFASDNSAPYAPSIATGAAATYVVAAWFSYLKPDGTEVWGPSLTGEVVIA